MYSVSVSVFVCATASCNGVSTFHFFWLDVGLPKVCTMTRFGEKSTRGVGGNSKSSEWNPRGSFTYNVSLIVADNAESLVVIVLIVDTTMKYFKSHSPGGATITAVSVTWFLDDLADSGSSAASTELLIRMQTRMKLPQYACEQNLKHNSRNLPHANTPTYAITYT